MNASRARATFERYLAAANGRDPAGLDEVLHPEFQDFYPQSGELTIGAENLRQILANYPGGYEGAGTERVVGAEDRWVTTPAFTVLRTEGTGDVFTAVQRARYPDGSAWYVIVIAQLKDDTIWRVQTFWAPTFEPPEWRAPFVRLVERPT